MAIEVTERWSDASATIADDLQWAATRAFDVFDSTGTMTEADAWSVTPPVGQPHPYAPLLAVKSKTTKRVGPKKVIVVTLTYAVPTAGKFSDQQNPLKQPPVVKWIPGSQCEPIDQAFGKGDALVPILNAAGDWFQGNVSENYGTLFLSYKRNEPYYDVRKHLANENRCNSDSFVIPKAGAVEPGQARFVHYIPTMEETFAATYTPVEYLFEFRSGTKKDSDGLWDGFKKRIKNLGTRAWFADPVSGMNAMSELFDANDNRISSGVPLDDKGMPVDTTIKPGQIINGGKPTKYPAIANPKPLPDGVTLEKAAYGVWWIKYRTKKTTSFSALQLNAF